MHEVAGCLLLAYQHLGVPLMRVEARWVLPRVPCYCLMQVLPIKLAGAMISLLSFWLCCRLSFLLPTSVRGKTVAKLGNWHCRTCLWWLGFWRVTWIRVGEQQQGSNGKAGGSGSGHAGAVGIVSNHISWCDILLHMSHSFPAFVARSQTRRQPIIGIIRWGWGAEEARLGSGGSEAGQQRTAGRIAWLRCAGLGLAWLETRTASYGKPIPAQTRQGRPCCNS